MLHLVIAAALASSHLICAHLDRPRDIERRHRLVLHVAIGVLRADVDVVDDLSFHSASGSQEWKKPARRSEKFFFSARDFSEHFLKSAISSIFFLHISTNT